MVLSMMKKKECDKITNLIEKGAVDCVDVQPIEIKKQAVSIKSTANK